MNNNFNFLNITQYDSYVINICENDYKKMKKSINFLKTKYNDKLMKLYNTEENNLGCFDFTKQKELIISHKKLIIAIIKDVLDIYALELCNLSIVFLSGSFARGTNKMSSDIDLHFFYINDNYNYVYEEIVLYIITRVINKSRDCIDPTFIFNIEKNNKIMITSKMNKNKLTIFLKCKTKKIKYSYKYGKKRRFYLQYTNTRNINKLFDYLNEQIIIHNEEWCHCFEIIKVKTNFDELYNKIYLKELNLINDTYIKKKIKVLKEKIKNNEFKITNNFISQYKNYYQSKTFEWIYEYISIIRFVLIKENNPIKYLNILDIYNKIGENSVVDRNILLDIYKYMWSLEKLSVYCYENKINYGLHNNDKINFSTEELDENIKLLKKEILNDLRRLEKIYE